jgi:nicotinamide riboside kinase
MSQTLKSPSPTLNRCVYLIGPQSTGKTTLIKALARRFEGDVPVIKEVARHVMREKGYTRDDVDSNDGERQFSLQRDIFAAQVEMENSLLSTKNVSFLSDRSGIDPLVHLAFFASPDAVHRITSTDEWKRLRSRYADIEKSVLVLLLPVIEFLVDDDIRYMAKSYEDWHALAGTFQKFMKEQGIPFVEIGEECVKIEERVALVLEYLISEDDCIDM